MDDHNGDNGHDNRDNHDRDDGEEPIHQQVQMQTKQATKLHGTAFKNTSSAQRHVSVLYLTIGK